MAGKNTFPVPETPLKILKPLTAGKIPFVIVGGAAIALHGIPRTTLDIDIVVPAESGTVNKLFSIIGKAGFFSSDKYIAGIMDRPDLLIGQWITLQDKNGYELVDVFFENSKEFKALLKRSEKVKGAKFNFYIASLRDLEKMKKISGRPIDLADIVLIREKLGRKKYRKDVPSHSRTIVK
ncbi:MAG: nucleotidyltransferase family protein [Candidatus Omnitrophica bacterium]|nr:nucleotidyltransferase family protein [Candidatus Omnitrophota bacterium]